MMQLLQEPAIPMYNHSSYDPGQFLEFFNQEPRHPFTHQQISSSSSTREIQEMIKEIIRTVEDGDSSEFTAFWIDLMSCLQRLQIHVLIEFYAKKPIRQPQNLSSHQHLVPRPVLKVGGRQSNELSVNERRFIVHLISLLFSWLYAGGLPLLGICKLGSCQVMYAKQLGRARQHYCCDNHRKLDFYHRKNK